MESQFVIAATQETFYDRNSAQINTTTPLTKHISRVWCFFFLQKSAFYLQNNTEINGKQK
jgi:hypothetical protein